MLIRQCFLRALHDETSQDSPRFYRQISELGVRSKDCLDRRKPFFHLRVLSIYYSAGRRIAV